MKALKNQNSENPDLIGIPIGHQMSFYSVNFEDILISPGHAVSTK